MRLTGNAPNTRNAVRGKALAAVVIPTTEKEIDRLVLNLKIWDQPAFHPATTVAEPIERPALIFCFSGHENPEFVHLLNDGYAQTKYLQQCFSGIEIRFIGLEKSLDYYEMDFTKPITGKGFKSGPNEQFFESMNVFAGMGGFIFYMESDCIPLRAGWLDAVMQLAADDRESWVIGSYYRGIAYLPEFDSRHFSRHLNGNALYRVGDPRFIQFVRDFWRPMLYKAIEQVDRTMAYDCLLSYVFSSMDSCNSNAAWEVFQQTGHRFRATSLLQNMSCPADNAREDIGELVDDVLSRSPETFFLHGSGFLRLMHQYAVHPAFIDGDAFSWEAVICASRRERVGAVQTRWLAAQDFPRLLLIGRHPFRDVAAEPQMKRDFLGNWPLDRFLQIWQDDEGDAGGTIRPEALHALTLYRNARTSRSVALTFEEAVKRCEAYEADVIHFFPSGSEQLFRLAEQLAAESKCPLVVHMMDDWMEGEGDGLAIWFEGAMRRILPRSALRLCINDAMSGRYAALYGGEWLPLANGVDFSDFPILPFSRLERRVSIETPYVVRYMGGLAHGVNFGGIKAVAEVVSSLCEHYPIHFEIYTSRGLVGQVKSELGGLAGVSVHGFLTLPTYKKMACEADLLVACYDFDIAGPCAEGLKISRKLIEFLATGTPVLAYGPSRIDLIASFISADCAQVVSDDSPGVLRSAFVKLLEHPAERRGIAERAQGYIEKFHEKNRIRTRYMKCLESLSIQILGE